MKLDKKIKSTGVKLTKPMYTTYYLLNDADTLSDLCIKTKEEFRLWKEFKRIVNETVTENINSDINITGFKVNEVQVNIVGDKVEVVRDNEEKKVFHKNNIKGIIKNLLK